MYAEFGFVLRGLQRENVSRLTNYQSPFSNEYDDDDDDDSARKSRLNFYSSRRDGRWSEQITTGTGVVDGDIVISCKPAF